jgi:hypothetical protein
VATYYAALDFAVAAGCKWDDTFQAPTGGVRLFFPGGVYRITHGLVIAPPTGDGHIQLSLEGATGMASTLLYDPAPSSSPAAAAAAEAAGGGGTGVAALSIKNVNRFAIRSIHLQCRADKAQRTGSVGLLISGMGKGTGTGPGIVENCQVDGFATGVQVGEDSGPGGSGHLPGDVDHAASELIFTHLSLQNCMEVKPWAVMLFFTPPCLFYIHGESQMEYTGA